MGCRVGQAARRGVCRIGDRQTTPHRSHMRAEDPGPAPMARRLAPSGRHPQPRPGRSLTPRRDPAVGAFFRARSPAVSPSLLAGDSHVRPQILGSTPRVRPPVTRRKPAVPGKPRRQTPLPDRSTAATRSQPDPRDRVLGSPEHRPRWSAPSSRPESAHTRGHPNRPHGATLAQHLVKSSAESEQTPPACPSPQVGTFRIRLRPDFTDIKRENPLTPFGKSPVPGTDIPMGSLR